jgi:drug/metabolite transporter (DMT)-like permease
MFHISTALLVSLLWSGVTIATKLLAGTLPSFGYAFLRFGIASLCLLPVVLMKPEKEKVTVRASGWILFLGLMIVFFNALFFSALWYASATSVTLIGAINPIITMLASAVIYQHIPNRYQLFAFLLSFMGVSFIITHGTMGISIFKASIGEFLMLAAVIAQVSFALGLKKISSHYSPHFLTFATGMAAVVFLIPFVANREFIAAMSNLSRTQWLLVAYIGSIGTGLGTYLFSYSIKHSGPARTSLTVFSTMPLFVAILSLLLFGIYPSLWQIIGGLLVVSSLIVGLQHTR